VTSSPRTSTELAALADQKLAEASNNYRNSRLLQALTFTLSAASVYATTSSAYVAALAVLVSQASSWALRARAQAHQKTGEAIRQEALVIDALGSSREGIDLASLLHEIEPKVQARASEAIDDEYFASNSRPGLIRLLDHLQENAFWNKHLYATSASRVTTISATFAAIVVIATLIALPFAPSGQTLTVLRILVVILSFGAILTQVNEIMAWRSAARSVEILDHRLEKLAGSSEAELRSSKISGLMIAFADYCVATAITPPVPVKIYKRERSKLNALWAERKERCFQHSP
jgi:hypothetical protein